MIEFADWLRDLLMVFAFIGVCCAGAVLATWVVLRGLRVLSDGRLREPRPKHPLGHCLDCGYNLTGNVSGICPECGTPVPDAVLSLEQRR